MSIEIRAVTVILGGKRILDHFSLTLPESGLLCFSGPSGCGKTTLLRLLAGLQKPDHGQVEGLAGRKLALVFQEDRLLPWLNVRENLRLVAEDAAVTARLAQVGLLEAAEKYPAELSGGMKRRLALARALAYGGEALLLDEPFNGLDEALAKRLLAEIKAEYAGRLVILLTHQVELAMPYIDRLYSFEGPPLTPLD